MMEDPITGPPKQKRDFIVTTIVVIIVALLLVLVIPLIGNKVNQKLPPGTVHIVSSVTIELNNSQPEPTPANFDQLIKVPFVRYYSYLNSQVSNVRFFSSSNLSPTSELYAWLEDNDSNLSASSNVWVNLCGTIIPAYGSVHIYMAFATKNTTCDSHWGLAPGLTQNYSQFDNGVYVFPFYDNFAGKSLDSKFSGVSGGSGGFSVNDGLILSYPSFSYAGIITQKKYPYPEVVEAYDNVVDQLATGGAEVFESLNDTLAFQMDYYGGGFVGAYERSSDEVQESLKVVGPNGVMNIISPIIKSANPAIRGIEWENTGAIYGLANDAYTQGLSSNSTTWSISNYYLGIFMGCSGDTSGMTSVTWLRARFPPPNNIMPTTSFLIQIENGSSVSPLFHTCMLPGSQASLMIFEPHIWYDATKQALYEH